MVALGDDMNGVAVSQDCICIVLKAQNIQILYWDN